ncbi:MAG: argininosuccinate lyase [Candidatus Hadarchaeales archaeon]
MLRKGRFEKEMDKRIAKYTSSLEEDIRIFRQVVKINIAHVLMLLKMKIISAKEASKILSALLELFEISPSKLRLRPEFEDIHMVVEDFVIKKVGDIGGKIHIAKSRNDQVVAALRLQIKEEILDIARKLLDLIQVFNQKADETAEIVMPGYTHLQVGEPTTFGHYLLSYVQMFWRDLERFLQAYDRVNSSPMGSCSFAGTSFNIDRKIVAELLGFERIDKNTMDAVSSRDWLLESMTASAILMTNLSRLSEDMIIWSSLEFGFVDFPEEFSSTSSIMPQKKNPIVFEVVRAKAAETIGLLSGAMSLVKGLPQSYNLDLQELTPLLWRSFDETKHAIEVVSLAVREIRVNEERMKHSMEKGFATIVELANELVRSYGLSFRQAHAVAGRVVLNAIKDGKTIKKINVSDVARASSEILGRKIEISESVLKKILDPTSAIKSRNIEGGPSLNRIKEEVLRLQKEIDALTRKLTSEKEKLEVVEKKLIKMAKEVCR